MDYEDTPPVNARAEKRRHWRHVCNKTGKCDRCPPHDGENHGRRNKKPRHKDHRP